MKVIITGGKEIADYKLVEAAVKESGFKVTEVVSGCEKGVDKLGEEYADHKMLPVKKFPAKWKDMSQPCIIAENQYGPYNKLAGVNRNKEMTKYSDAILVVTNGSDNSHFIIEQAKEANLLVYVYKVD